MQYMNSIQQGIQFGTRNLDINDTETLRNFQDKFKHSESLNPTGMNQYR